MNNNIKNRALITVDGTYLMYFSTFSAIKKWKKTSNNAKILKEPEETDQDNLPDLTVYSDFCRCIEDALIKKLESVDRIVSKYCEDTLDDIQVVDKVFSLDSPISHNWRKTLYPEYKLQRKISPKQFNLYKLMNYMENILRNKLDIQTNLGYNIIKVDGAEGDDILASLLLDTDKKYSLKILIASDKDFLQLDNVVQFDLFGTKKEILPTTCSKLKVSLTPKEYLLVKTIIGDSADNIPGVFRNVGEVKAINLIKNKDQLRQRLRNDNQALNRFMLNKKIISFEYIPNELKQTILSEAEVMFKKAEKENELDLSGLMKL